jgi:hypothetical protein
MSQPVKLSDALVLDARIAAKAQERSIAGQVEFWAKLGQSLEPVLTGRQAAELRQAGKVRPLSELVATVETTEGRTRSKTYLASRPYPHYSQFPGQARVYIRTDADGAKMVGRFVNRAFVAVDLESEGSQGAKETANAKSSSKLVEHFA